MLDEEKKIGAVGLKFLREKLAKHPVINTPKEDTRSIFKLLSDQPPINSDIKTLLKNTNAGELALRTVLDDMQKSSLQLRDRTFSERAFIDHVTEVFEHNIANMAALTGEKSLDGAVEKIFLNQTHEQEKTVALMGYIKEEIIRSASQYFQTAYVYEQKQKGFLR